MKRFAVPSLLLLSLVWWGAYAVDKTAGQDGSFAGLTRPQANPPTEDVSNGLVTRKELIAARLRRLGIDRIDPVPTRPTNRADSLDWQHHRDAAARIPTLKIVVSIYDRHLWLIDGQDTVLSAPAGVGMGSVQRGSRRFEFSTPRGLRRVRGKEEQPLWIPPDWHYMEIYDRVRHFPTAGVRLRDGGIVVRREDRIGIQRAGRFEPLPPEHPLVFDRVMYIPPVGTVNREVPEVLGRFKLDTGNGILIHGTNDPLSVGLPVTHGCIRLDDKDLEELFRRVTIGTPVYVY